MKSRLWFCSGRQIRHRRRLESGKETRLLCADAFPGHGTGRRRLEGSDIIFSGRQSRGWGLSAGLPAAETPAPCGILFRAGPTVCRARRGEGVRSQGPRERQAGILGTRPRNKSLLGTRKVPLGRGPRAARKTAWSGGWPLLGSNAPATFQKRGIQHLPCAQGLGDGVRREAWTSEPCL